MKCGLRLPFMQGVANGGLLLAVMVLCSVYLYGQSGTAEAHYDTGIKALEGGDLNGAEQQFRATLKLRPDFFEARQNLAITLAQKGNLREAAAGGA